MRRLLLMLSCAACALPATLSAQDEKPLSETCPNLTAEEIEAIENYDGEFSENALYARAYCVSVEEAERRMEIQLRGSIGPRTEPGPAPVPDAPDDSIGSLQATLREKEPDTFAGLWIQHQPTYGVAVAFTRNAAATLAKYTDDPLFFPVERPGPTLLELRATQERVIEDLVRLGFAWHGAGASEMTGKVEIDLAQSADPIRAAAARGEIDLPAYVVLKEPAPFPIAAPPVPVGDTRVRGFPQFARRTDGGIRTLVGVPDVPARLELRGGCLWLHPEGEEPKIAIWERHEALDLTDPARVAVMNRFSGEKVFAGTQVVLAGLQPNEVDPPTDIVGNEGCPGPYRVVRGVEPYEQWAAARRENAILGRERELGSRAVAEADYAADMARLTELQEWRSRVLAEHADVVAAIWIDEGQGTAHVYRTQSIAMDALVPVLLRGFVTDQVVPQGAAALEAVRADISAQLESAGVEAQVRISEIDGYVAVRPADLAALSEAGERGALQWPALVRIEPDWVGPFFDPDVPGRREDPEAIWYPLEVHPDFAAIRAIVEKTPVMRPEPPRPGETESRWVSSLPSKAGSLQQTHFLIAYGVDLDEIEDLRRAGFDPVTATEDMNGRQTIERRAMAATDIVIAEPVAIDPADAGRDGYFSTVRWRVIDVLKGDARPGEELRQRMASGARTDKAGTTAYGQGMDEPFLLAGLPNSLEPGSRWVLHLNDALYRHSAFVNGGAGAARADGDWYVSIPWMTPALIGEDGIARPVSLYPEPIPVDELRERVLPIQRAYRIAGAQVQ